VGGGISKADDDQLVTGRAVSAQHPRRPIRTRRIKRCASFQAVGGRGAGGSLEGGGRSAGGPGFDPAFFDGGRGRGDTLGGGRYGRIWRPLYIVNSAAIPDLALVSSASSVHAAASSTQDSSKAPPGSSAMWRH